jgi:8-hydroxy-5-deazaflavin:NADPH oxidoreductase
MSYAIIGFGKIGQALAKAFARSGIEVSVATTRDPESFASAAATIGPEIIPKKLADAVKADIIFLAVRYESHRDVARALPTWKGKTIIDVTNAYGVSTFRCDPTSWTKGSHSLIEARSTPAASRAPIIWRALTYGSA